ncbi:MAG: hypothetical protein BGP06_17410 [Rhizobiales bacterium 65-9]|nr:flavin reductase [Hyphomicrobiales bacterium]OJY40210.1 MAG: hypothetical protein BGP06_17410 [Rhizobiales bacterium 65-9]
MNVIETCAAPSSETARIVETGAPENDIRAFRRCLGQYPTGVTVVTAAHDGQLGGVTANSFTSLSIEPPLVVWALQKSSQSFPIFSSAAYFSINILATDQIDVSQKFAKSSPDKFSGVGFSAGLGGAPILHGAAAVLECKRHAQHDAGDHVLLIGQVETFTRFEAEALAFQNGRYAATLEHPAMRSGKPLTEAASLHFHHFFVVLLSRAYHHMQKMMDHAREQKGLDFNESRLLSVVSAYPGRGLDGLLPATFLGRQSAEDALGALIDRGFVERDAAGTLSLTAMGGQILKALMQTTKSVEDEMLSRIPAHELDAARRMLTELVAGDGLGGKLS